MTISELAKIALDEGRVVFASRNEWDEFKLAFDPKTGVYMGTDMNTMDGWRQVFLSIESHAADDWYEVKDK